MFFVRCIRSRRMKNNRIFFYKNYIKSKPFFKIILRKNKDVSHSFIKRLCSVIIINKTNRIKKQSKGITIKSLPSSSYNKNSIYKNKAVITKTKSFEKQNFVFQIKNFLEEVFQTSNKNISYEIKDSFTSPIRVFRPFMQLPGIEVNYKKKSEYSTQIFIFSKILYKFITIFITIINKDLINNLKDSEKYKKNLLIFKKLHQFQKIAFSLRLYKTFLPIVKKFIKNKKYSKKQKYSKTYRQLQRRAKRLRFSVKRRKKKNRGLKNIRRKSVHFFIPAYLQMDFRTLRAVKVQSPNLEEIYYPFRISLPKRYSFYRSQGF